MSIIFTVIDSNMKQIKLYKIYTSKFVIIISNSREDSAKTPIVT